MVIEISPEDFEAFINDGIAAIPAIYKKRLQNVAFIVEDYPSQEQRVKLNLYPHETLFGLYEGVPLPRRNGTLKLLPDKITVFKKTIEAVSQTPEQAREQVRHTIWHEVAHYFGLDHQRIHELDSKRYNNKQG